MLQNIYSLLCQDQSAQRIEGNYDCLYEQNAADVSAYIITFLIRALTFVLIFAIFHMSAEIISYVNAHKHVAP